MSARVLRRALAGAVGVSLLVGVGLVPLAEETDAAYTDQELAAATLATVTLAPPVITAVPLCRSVLLGGDVVRVAWKWPSADPPYSELSASNAQWKIGSGDWASMPTTGPVSGVYTTTFTQGILDGLLGSLLGGTFTAQLRSTAGSQWASAGQSSMTYTANILGVLLAPKCTYANGT